MKRIFIIIAALLALLLGSAWYTVFYTSYGVNALLAAISNLQSMRIVVTGVEGTLAGPLTVQHFELDHKYVHVSASDIRLSIAPRALFAQTVRVDELTIGRADVTTKPIVDQSESKPLRFFTSLLLLQADTVDIREARFTHYGGFTQSAQRVRARARITAQRVQIDRIAVDAEQFSASGYLALRARRPIPLEADLAFRAPVPRGPDFEGKVVVSGHIEHMNINAVLREPSTAQFKSEFTRGAGPWQLAGTLVAPNFSLAPWLERPPLSFQQATLDLTVSSELVQLQGMVTVPEADPAPLQLDIHGHYAERVLAVTRANVQLSESTTAVTAAGRLEFAGGRPKVNATAQWRDLSWPLRGETGAAVFVSRDGQLSVSGDWPYAIGAEAEAIVRNDIPVQLSMNGELSDTELRADNFTLQLLDGQAIGNGALKFKPQSWQVDVVASTLNPAPLSAQLPGSISFDAKASGVGYGRDARFALDMSSLRGRLRGEPLSGQGAIARDNLGWTVKRVALTLGEANLNLSGTYTDKIDLQWSLNAPALQSFVAEARGSVQSEGTIRGTYAMPHIDATLRGEQLSYGDWRVESIDARANTNLAGNDDSQIEVTTRSLRVRQYSLGSPQLTAKMNKQQQSRYAVNQRTQWQIDRFCIRWPEASAPETIESVDDADRQVCGNAQWSRDGTWLLRAQSGELPLNLFDDSFPAEARYGGKWQVNIDAQSTAAQGVLGKALVSIADATLMHQPVEGEVEVMELGTGQIALTADAATYVAQASLTTPGTTSINANARIERRENMAWNNAPLTGQLRARTADANLLPLIFPDIDHSDGELNADLAVRGSVALPEFSGRIELARGELALYRYNLHLREMALTANFIDNRLDFDGSALAGEGNLRIQGQMAWRNLEPVGNLHFTGERLTIADIPEYKILASPDVRFAIDGKRIDISGEVFIPTARLQPTDLTGATQLSPDARLTSAPPEDEKRGFDIYTDVRVRIGDDVLIDTLGLQGKLGGTVNTIAQPDERAIGRGELSVSDGRYEAYGQKLDIARGRLLFNSTPLDDPGLDIQAERRLEEQRVGVNVRGTLRAPRISLFAEPSLTQTQIVSYLLTGKPIDDLKSQDTASVGLARDAIALQGGGVLASQLGRRIGLEEVGIESSGANDTSLVLGKFLSPRLFVSYGISLTESINTLKLRYTLSDRWLFKSEMGQEQSADLEFRIQR
jgi:translocation and assembly module TamB